MERISDYLRADHERLGELLSRAVQGPYLDEAAYGEFRAGLLRHIAIEEKVLLPAVREARGGVPIERSRRLRAEHGAIASLLVGSPTLDLCAEIRILLDAHNPLEESPGGVYEECEESLGAAVSAELVRTAQEYRKIRLAPYTDGPGVVRTAAAALAAMPRALPPSGGSEVD